MADEFIVTSVKDAVRLSREGKADASFARYQALFDAPQFPTAPVEDQRQALKLMVTAKGTPEPLPPAVTAAFQSAVRSLSRIVQATQLPVDHELLGLAYLKLGDVASAKQVFEAGLAIAHAKNDAEWAGQLLKRVSMI